MKRRIFFDESIRGIKKRKEDNERVLFTENSSFDDRKEREFVFVETMKTWRGEKRKRRRRGTLFNEEIFDKLIR